MRIHALMPLVIMLCFLLGCGPGASSDAMKNLQNRINLVENLGEINRSKTVTKSAIDGINDYIERSIDDESTKQELLAKSEELWESRKNEDALDKVTREMSTLVSLPEKYAKAYGF